MHRVQDHRQPQVDMVSLTDKTYKNAYTYTTLIYLYHTVTPEEFPHLIPYHMAITMLFVFYIF